MGFHTEISGSGGTAPNDLTEQQQNSTQQQIHPLGVSGADNSNQKNNNKSILNNGNQQSSNAPTQQNNNNTTTKKDLQQHLSSSPDTR